MQLWNTLKGCEAFIMHRYVSWSMRLIKHLVLVVFCIILYQCNNGQCSTAWLINTLFLQELSFTRIMSRKLIGEWRGGLCCRSGLRGAQGCIDLLLLLHKKMFPGFKLHLSSEQEDFGCHIRVKVICSMTSVDSYRRLAGTAPTLSLFPPIWALPLHTHL